MKMFTERQLSAATEFWCQKVEEQEAIEFIDWMKSIKMSNGQSLYDNRHVLKALVDAALNPTR